MLISVKEAEKKYGIPKRTLYYMINIGELPRIRMTRERVFLKEEDIEKLIEDNYGRENQEIEI